MSRNRRDVDLWDLVVWAIQVQHADRAASALFAIEAAADGRPRAARSADGCAAIADNAAVGCPIDGSGAIRGVSPSVHPDAEAVMDAIERLPVMDRAAICQFARGGDAPEWSDGRQVLVAMPNTGRGGAPHHIAGRWEPMRALSAILGDLRRRVGIGPVDRLGRPRCRLQEPGYAYRPQVDGSQDVMVRWCPVEPSPPDSWIAASNGIYSRWHAAMMALLGRLEGVRLSEYRVVGFGAPAQPWRDSA